MTAYLFIGSLILGMIALAGEHTAPASGDEQMVRRGKVLYNIACSPCHGSDGSGRGPLAANMYVQPRNLVRGTYRNRSTHFGKQPTDYDIYRTITEGLHNTPMPWYRQMNMGDRLAVVSYLKTLSKKFSDPARRSTDVDDYNDQVPNTPASLERGRALYLAIRCDKCHGTDGQGDLPNSWLPKDDLGQPVYSTDLTNPAEYKYCTSVEDVYRILSNEMHAGGLDDAQRWDLSNYTWSLQSADQYPPNHPSRP